MQTTVTSPAEPTAANGTKVIATHNGPFHADDVFAVAIIRLNSPKTEYEIVRTRDPEKLAKADIVLDVGGVNDVKTRRFDHHQKGGAGVRWDTEVPYATAGIVWSHYGYDAAIFTLCHEGVIPEMKLGEERLGKMMNYVTSIVDETLISSIDAADVGHTDANCYSVSAAISSFNPTWIEGGGDFDTSFISAVELAEDILRRTIINACGEWKAKAIVAEAVRQAHTDSNPWIVLEEFCPWQKALLENEHGGEIVLAVFPAPEGDWRVQVVPRKLGEFGARMDLPKKWAGLRDEEFQEASGVEDAIFCHNGRFICGAHSQDGALTLASEAVKWARLGS